MRGGVCGATVAASGTSAGSALIEEAGLEASPSA